MVEGIGVPGGGYTEPLILLRVTLECVAYMLLMPPFDTLIPPFTLTVERKMVEGRIAVPDAGGYTCPFTELTLMLDHVPVMEFTTDAPIPFVLISAVLI
jgi:hypothetical protein